MPISSSGLRLSEWIASRGWSKAEFARRMEILPQTLTKYLSGQVSIDNLATKLLREGADVQWIVSGEHTESADEAAIIALLKGSGITKPEQVRHLLEAAKGMLRLSDSLRDTVEVLGTVNDLGGTVRVRVHKTIDSQRSEMLPNSETQRTAPSVSLAGADTDANAGDTAAQGTGIQKGSHVQ
jgi:transcriptional regulator with XRE-family HTH domain